MPIRRKLSLEELEQLAQNGIDTVGLVDKEVQLFTDSELTGGSSEMTAAEAAKKTARAGIGRYVGAGAGALLGGKGGAAIGTAAAPGPGTAIGAVIGAIGGGLVGAAAGTKGQELVEGPEKTAEIRAEAARAMEERPWVSLGTDIGLSALASGGKPSLSQPLRAARGTIGTLTGKGLSAIDRAALAQVGEEALSPAGRDFLMQRAGDVAAMKNVGLQAALQPSIDIGASLATTGKLPTGRQLIADVAGGALFSDMSRLGRWAYKGLNAEPTPEPTSKGTGERIVIKDIPELSVAPDKMSPFLEKTPEGQYVIDPKLVRQAYTKMYPKPEKPTGPEDAEGYKKLAQWKQRMAAKEEDIRKELHKNFLAREEKLARIKLSEPKAEPKPEPTAKPVEVVKKPELPFGAQKIVDELEAKRAGEEAELARIKQEDRKKFVEESNRKIAEETEAEKKLADALQEIGDQVPSKYTRLANYWVKEYAGGDVEAAKADIDKGIKISLSKNDEASVREYKAIKDAIDKMTPQDFRTNEPSDYQRFQELSAKRQELMAKGDFESEEFLSVWREMEAIKNKNKGMPPTDEGLEKFNQSLEQEVNRRSESLSLRETGTIADRFNRAMDSAVLTHVRNSIENVRPQPGDTVLIDVDNYFHNTRQGKIALRRLAEEGVRVTFADRNYAPGKSTLKLSLQEGHINLNDDFILEASKPPTETQARLSPKGWEKFETTLPKPTVKGTPDTIQVKIGDATHPIDVYTLTDGTTVKTGATAKAELARLSQEAGPYSQLAKLLHDTIDEQSAKTPIKITNGKYSKYDADSDSIEIMGEHGEAPVVAIEEIVHAATVKNIPNSWRYLRGNDLKLAMDNYLQTGSSESLKEVIRTYYLAAKGFGIEEMLFGSGVKAPKTEGLMGEPYKTAELVEDVGYQMGSLYEYIAGVMKSKRLQAKLNDMPSGLNDGKSLWTRFVNAVRSIIGLPVRANSLLERALKASGELIQEPRIGAQDATQTRPITQDNRGEYLRTSERENIPTDQSQVRGEEGATTIHSDSTKQGEGVSLPESFKKRGFSFFPFLTSRIDKIAKKFPNKVGYYVTDGLKKFTSEFDIKSANIGQGLIALTRGHSPASVSKVYQRLYEIDDAGTSNIPLTQSESRLADSIIEHLREIRREQQKSGPKVRLPNGRLRVAGIKEEGYMFNILDRNVAYEWAENAGSEKSKAYDVAYLQHLVKQGVSPDEANAMLFEYKRALGNNVARDVEFKALRKAEGFGLPWELADKNFASAALRYGQRAGRDLAFFKHIQSDPIMRKALSIADETGKLMKEGDMPEVQPLGQSEEVSSVMRSVYGVDMPVNRTLMAAARAAGNTVMGIGTAVRNLATMPAIAATYVQTRQLPLMARALMEWNDRKARAFQYGASKATYADFDAAGYMADDPNPVINLMNKYSTFMRKYQGRDFSDKFEGEYYFSLGELLASSNIALAKQGNKEALRFLNRFGDIIDGGVNRLVEGKATQDDISRIAKRFVDATRGTYGAEGLPSWALEGELAPFAALSRFSIEKSNMVWRDVIEPWKQGNWGPLLRYGLGSLGVGVLIEKLNEELSGKRGPDPTVREAWLSGKPEHIAAKIIGLGQLASFAGIISDGAKAATQVAQSKELRYNQPLSFPLYTLISETLAGNVSDAVEAIKSGEDPTEVLGLLATSIAGQSVQTMRYISANANPEETARREKFRDISVFRQLEGGAGRPTIRSNQFTDLETKKFKRTKNIDEAIAQVPELIQNALEKAKGDPFELRRILRGLKANSYQTMPSLETMPLSFLRYVQFLERTQGKEEAQKRLNDYIMQNVANQAKSEMIP